jgi:hypothetical protein
LGLTEPVRIRDARDLFEVLTSGSFGAKLAVLKDIQQNPRRALALGPHEGEDFVDFLLRQIPESTGVIKKLQTLCLMSYDDHRTAAFMAEEFARCGDAATVLHLGERLTLNKGADFFRPFLWSEKPAQALAASRVCCTLPDLDSKEQLRIALLLDGEFEPPPIEKKTLDIWMHELLGRNRVRARQLVEQRVSESLLLWNRWSEFPTEEQEWLVSLTESADPILAKQTVATLMKMETKSAVLAKAAVRLEVELPQSLVCSDNAEVRAVAVSAGMADAHLGVCLSTDSPLPVAVAAVGRCETDQLLGLLHDVRWQVRSEAMRALIDSEERPLQEVRSLTGSETLATKATAVEILLAWGDDEWLRGKFLGS